jgi:hypothetical protein
MLAVLLQLEAKTWDQRLFLYALADGACRCTWVISTGVYRTRGTPSNVPLSDEPAVHAAGVYARALTNLPKRRARFDSSRRTQDTLRSHHRHNRSFVRLRLLSRRTGKRLLDPTPCRLQLPSMVHLPKRSLRHRQLPRFPPPPSNPLTSKILPQSNFSKAAWC